MSDKKTIILVAEDEAELLEMSAIALMAKNFDVLQAKNGKEAMEWLSRKGDEIGLILLDIVMPVMDGFEVLEAIGKNEQYKKIPVVVCSNLDSAADRSAAFALGAKDFFEKVRFNPSQVADKVFVMINDRV